MSIDVLCSSGAVFGMAAGIRLRISMASFTDIMNVLNACGLAEYIDRRGIAKGIS